MLFTHLAKYQARVAMADMRGRPVRADYRAIPRVIFTDPETAAVGLTAAQARDTGHEVASAVVDLPSAIARPYRVLLGAWAVAPLASEWIHQAVLAIKAEVLVDTLLETVAQFPSYTEGYLSALQKLEL
jgi:dihydrolipoamide dehydrogenase